MNHNSELVINWIAQQLNYCKVNNYPIILLGDAGNSTKFAYEIYQVLKTNNFIVMPFNKLESLMDFECLQKCFLINCMHPAKSVNFLVQLKPCIKNVLCQPGVESPNVFNWLQMNQIEYHQGCILQYFINHRN